MALKQGTAAESDTVSVVIAEACALAEELRPGRAPILTAKSELDSDLRFDSLARAELLLRLERAFEIDLPEQLIASSETLQDLADAVTRRSGAAKRSVKVTHRPSPVATDEARPSQARTLVEVLEWHVSQHPDRTHVYLYDQHHVIQELSYRDLFEDAQQVAAALIQRGLLPQQSVAIMLPTSREYLASFFGILLAGAVPVPIYPPARPSLIEDHIRRHTSILANAQSVFMITVPEARSLAWILRAHVDHMRDVLIPEELFAEPLTSTLVRSRVHDIALLQYTSGSTGNPKGVVLTHANLMANIRAINEAADIKPNDVYVSWLPLYHDMGLIASWLGSLYFSVPFVLMSPLSFLVRPQRWLWAIHNHGGTISGAPNFAYELCLRKIRDEDIEGLDLSSWRIAYNGAEPVSPKTLQCFADRFQSFRFHKEALMPVFGLAECSVGLTCSNPGRGVVIDRIQRDPFMASGRAVPAADDDDTALSFPACGWPLPGHEIRIVDATGMELGDRQQGRLEFRGPSATSGYFRNAEQTRDLFHGDWLDSNDLAYVADGDLYVTGRVKDMIIRAGRNIHPQEVEEAVGGIGGVRRGCVAVFSSIDQRSGTESLVVLAETRLEAPEERAALQQAINDTCINVIGMPPDDIVLVAPQTVPKTSSGKIRRAASRALYEKPGQGARRLPVWWQMTRLIATALVPQLRHQRHSVVRLLYSGYAWMTLFAVGTPVWMLTAISPSARWSWRLVHRAAKWLLRLWRVPLTVSGKMPAGLHPVIVANHASYFDGLVLIASCPEPLNFVAKAELRQQLVAGTFLKRLGVNFVERFDFRQGVADTSHLIGAVHTGQQLVFFPEGTFTRAAGLAPFHMGAFLVAAQTCSEVLPVTLRGTRSLLRGGSWRIQRHPVSVVIGEPIAPQGGDWRSALALRDAARKQILRQSREPDLDAARS